MTKELGILGTPRSFADGGLAETAFERTLTGALREHSDADAFRKIIAEGARLLRHYAHIGEEREESHRPAASFVAHRADPLRRFADECRSWRRAALEILERVEGRYPQSAVTVVRRLAEAPTPARENLSFTARQHLFERLKDSLCAGIEATERVEETARQRDLRNPAEPLRLDPARGTVSAGNVEVKVVGRGAARSSVQFAVAQAAAEFQRIGSSVITTELLWSTVREIMKSVKALPRFDEKGYETLYQAAHELNAKLREGHLGNLVVINQETTQILGTNADYPR